MTIGILKEISDENRVAMLPESVSALVKMNVTMLVETGAGLAAFANDAEYEKAGAKVAKKADVIAQSDVVIKIQPPTTEETAMLKDGQVLLSVLNPYFNTALVKELAAKNITAFSMDVVPRTTRAQAMDILSSMATVAGYKAVLTAANTLPKFFPMFMTAAGTIKPANMLILGAGVAGLQAI
ncbi:MAG TPA: NAD(P)(+) transhydrogenase (Re/Si-specific) subunit alpha, partial [Bacteroidales bacterium]|nr:NAD(P)(+) transhydrogenase (Re/Si-specific) subunit alpha [Bacteroidales bacterium]